MAYLESPQAFVRALKAPSDDGDISKIEMARQAWDDVAFAVPSKPELVVDFALTRLLKDRSRTDASPILDVRYWSLISDVLLPSSSHPSPISIHKTWLIPLLNRTPLALIVVSLLAQSASVSTDTAQHLLSVSSRTVSLLWSIAVLKTTSDTLLECFGALLSVYANSSIPKNALTPIGRLVTSSLRTSFRNSSNKKKLHHNFLQSHWQNWIDCVHRSPGTDDSGNLLSEIVSTGDDILFNPDTLKQLADAPESNELFASFRPTAHSFSVLPGLLTSFVQAMRKHRSLFGQGHLFTTEVSSAGMRIFAACEALCTPAPSELDIPVQMARLGLLRVVDRENLLGTGLLEPRQMLQQVSRRDVEALNADLLDTKPEQFALILDCLCVISSIDHGILEPVVPSIFSNLLLVPPAPSPAASSALEFLRLCIAYHTKARTLPTLASQIFSAITSSTFLTSSAQALYARATASPLLSLDFLAAISKANRAFITPGQALTTASDIFSMLEEAWDTYNAAARKAASDRGVGSRKKTRKLDLATQPRENAGADRLAAAFALKARLATAVFTSLPIHSVTVDVQEAIRENIKAALRMFLPSAFRMMREGSDRGTPRSDSEARRDNMWASEAVAAAALRFRYSVEATQTLGIVLNIEHEVYEPLFSLLDTKELPPELYLETCRFLLRKAGNLSVQQRGSLFDSLLGYLRLFIPASGSGVPFSTGQSSNFDLGSSGNSHAATALLRLLLDRFLSVLELYGTPEQRDQVTELMFKSITASASAVPECALSPGTVVLQCLRSAQFWEQPELRMSFLTSVHATITAMDVANPAQLLAASHHSLSFSDVGVTAEQVDRAAEGFTLLLYTPSEYIARSGRVDVLRRADILQRAIVFDLLVTALKSVDVGRSDLVLRVRTFILRLFNHAGSGDHPMVQSYLHYLLRLCMSFMYDDVTLDVVSILYRALIKAAENGASEQVTEVVGALMVASLPSPLSSSHHSAEDLIQRFMAVLVGNFALSSFHSELLSTFNMLLDNVMKKLQEFVTQSQELGSTAHISQRLSLLRLWGQSLSLGSWLGVTDIPHLGLGLRLVQAVLSSPANSSMLAYSTVLSVVFSILLSELHCCSASEREAQLENIVATYVLFAKVSELPGEGVHGEEVLDDLSTQLVGVVKTISTAEFSHLLKLVGQALSATDDPERLTVLVHLGSLMLHDAPEGTLSMVRSHLTQWLVVFVDAPAFTSNSMLRLHTLKFLSKQCSNRPASIRSINVLAIWSLLSRTLIGAQVHETEPSAGVFHEVIAVISALVRLRRDLVSNTLPQLCIILRQLILCLRRPRPNLGAKQHKLVASSLPAWIDLDRPLGAEQSRALSRLLTTLATKSIVRMHGSSSAEARKAESLARPLSKHIAYVLAAYIDALNDPLCVLPAAVRHELQPGLFVLCEMLNGHVRDALMVSSLDSGGKLAMKALWRDFEKQRYVGRG